LDLIAQHLPALISKSGIDMLQRFVEDEHLRASRHRAGHTQAGTFALRERSGIRIAQSHQSEPRQQPIHEGGISGRFDSCEVLSHGQMRPQTEVRRRPEG
jgi:hypothetical protein